MTSVNLVSKSSNYDYENTVSTLVMSICPHWRSIGPTLPASAQQWTGTWKVWGSNPMACRLKWSSQVNKSIQQDCLMILLVLIMDSKIFTNLFLRDTMKKCFMTGFCSVKKQYSPLTDAHNNYQRAEKDLL